MAAPTISSVVAVPPSVAPGGRFVVTITAADADTKAQVLTGKVTDATGNVSADVTVTVMTNDTLTYTLTQPAGAGFTITPRAGAPGVFDCVAP